MAILKNVEIWYPRLDPNKPNTKYNKDNGTWEIQLRTKDKKQKAEWAAAGLKPKTIDDDDKGIYYACTIRKKSKKTDGKPNQPVKVINGSLEEIDPKTIGNGSVGNVRIFQYEYGDDNKTANMLMAVQITKLNEYIPRPSEDDFEMTETEIVRAGSLQDNDDIDMDDDPF